MQDYTFVLGLVLAILSGAFFKYRVLATLGFEGDEDSSDDSSGDDDTFDDTSEESDDDSEDTSDDDSDDSTEDSDAGSKGDLKISKGATRKEGKSRDDIASKILFTPIKNLPKELQPAAKRLISNYNEKMQGLSRYKQYAEAFQTLRGNPDFVKWFGDYTASKNKGASRDTKETDTSNTGEKDTESNAIRSLIRDVLREEMQPFHEDRAKNQEREATTVADKQKAKLTEDYPQWENYQDEISEVQDLYNGRIRLDHAFKIAAFEDAADVGGGKTLKMLKDTKNAGSHKPTNNNKTLTGKKNGKVDTIEKAFELAVEGIEI